ncbi:MAG: permease, partial [Proteocatella sp.]
AIGSLAAGPLYAAFPVAAILIKKKARLAYVIFFLGVWSSTKLPLLMYEITSFGATFTAIHVATNLSVFLIGSFAIEKMLSIKEHEDIYENAAVMEK